MDFSKFALQDDKAEKGEFLHFVSPSGAKLYHTDAQGNEDDSKPVGMTLLSADSKKMRKLRHKSADALKASLKIGRGGKVHSATSEEQETESISYLAHAVTHVHHIEINGEPIGASHDECVAFFEEFPFAKEQAEEFMSNRENYLKE